MLIESFAQGNILNYKPMHKYFSSCSWWCVPVSQVEKCLLRMSSIQQYCTPFAFYHFFSLVIDAGCLLWCANWWVCDSYRCSCWCCVGMELQVVRMKCCCYASSDPYLSLAYVMMSSLYSLFPWLIFQMLGNDSLDSDSPLSDTVFVNVSENKGIILLCVVGWTDKT